MTLGDIQLVAGWLDFGVNFAVLLMVLLVRNDLYWIKKRIAAHQEAIRELEKK